MLGTSAHKFERLCGKESVSALCAALATEDPEPSLLEEAPHGRDEPLISPTMWVHLIVQAVYQLVILFLIIYAGPQVITEYKLPSHLNTYGNVDAHVSPLSSSIHWILPLTIRPTQDTLPS